MSYHSFIRRLAKTRASIENGFLLWKRECRRDSASLLLSHLYVIWSLNDCIVTIFLSSTICTTCKLNFCLLSLTVENYCGSWFCTGYVNPPCWWKTLPIAINSVRIALRQALLCNKWKGMKTTARIYCSSIVWDCDPLVEKQEIPICNKKFPSL